MAADILGPCGHPGHTSICVLPADPGQRATFLADQATATPDATWPEVRDLWQHDLAVDDEAIHGFFGLTYSNYLVLHRTILQSMPASWQREFVALLNELRYAAEGVPGADAEFWVRARDGNKFIEDMVPHYQRGRARVALKPTREG